jgi:hypothetical protein
VLGGSVVVVVDSRAIVVVVVGSTVVVVGPTVVVVVVGPTVVVGATVVVVGSMVLSGAGWGSVVVGAVDAGGLGELGGPDGLGAGSAGGEAAVVESRRASEAGTADGGSAGAPPVVDVDDVSARVLEGATEGAGTVVGGAPVVSVGRAPTTVGTGGGVGTRAAEATMAARTAKVSPKATSMRRRGSRCSARWRGVRVGMGCCRIVRLWLGLRILRIVRSKGKSRWVIMSLLM